MTCHVQTFLYKLVLWILLSIFKILSKIKLYFSWYNFDHYNYGIIDITCRRNWLSFRREIFPIWDYIITIVILFYTFVIRYHLTSHNLQQHTIFMITSYVERGTGRSTYDNLTDKVSIHYYIILYIIEYMYNN